MSSYETTVEALTNFISQKDQSGLKTVRLMQMYLMNNSDNSLENEMLSNIPTAEIGDTGLKPIGTWHPKIQNGEVIFLRQKQSDSIFWESSRSQIKYKKPPNTKRLCFIGESAAAGMFFTPNYSPAIALASHLSQFSKTKWDVVDLTRSCMNVGGLLATCKASLQLDPDFVIIIAGNNWFSDVIFEHDAPVSKRRTYLDIFETLGAVGLAQNYKNSLETVAEKAMQKIVEISKGSTAEFIFALPASNYADWERRCPIYWLGKDTAQWYELYRLATKALENARYEEALKIGCKMLTIDGKVSPTSNRIIANALIALGRPDEAYGYCVAESDYAVMYDQLTSFPGMPSFVRKICKKFNDPNNMTIIDLEDIFIDYLGTKILDKSLFVDYCHMTPETFNVAMAPVASHLLNKTQGKSNASKKPIVDWRDIAKNSSALEIDPFRMAISYFHTGLYKAHLDQPVINTNNLEPIIEFFQKAVSYSKKILDVMELYVQARSCYYGAGFSLSKAGQRLFKLINSPLDFPVAQASPGVDALAIEAICTTLERNSRKGFKLMEEYQKHYIRLLKRGIDLTEPLYIERINEVVRLAVDSELSTRRKVPYFKSWWPSSYFSLVTDIAGDLDLKIVCRRLGEGSITENFVNISINNNQIGSIPITRKWTRHHIDIPKNLIIPGFNRLSLEWPKLTQSEDLEIKNLTTRYSLGLKVNMFPVFGEVFSLVVIKKKKVE
jgi:hypothetical protein